MNCSELQKMISTIKPSLSYGFTCLHISWWQARKSEAYPIPQDLKRTMSWKHKCNVFKTNHIKSPSLIYSKNWVCYFREPVKEQHCLECPHQLYTCMASHMFLSRTINAFRLWTVTSLEISSLSGPFLIFLSPLPRVLFHLPTELLLLPIGLYPHPKRQADLLSRNPHLFSRKRYSPSRSHDAPFRRLLLPPK